MEQLRILIIDDSIEDFEMMAYYLTKQNDYEISSQQLTTLSEGRNVIEQSHMEYDLVFLDLNLPDSDYQNTLNSIKSISIHLPVIVLTGMDIEQGYVGIKNGAQDFINKNDLNPKDIVYKVLFSIKRYQLYKQLEYIAFFNRETGHYTSEFLDYYIQKSDDQLAILIFDITLYKGDKLSNRVDYAVSDGIVGQAMKLNALIASDKKFSYVILAKSVHDIEKLILKYREMLIQMKDSYKIDLLKYGYAYDNVDKTVNLNKNKIKLYEKLENVDC
jgi:DNA-binding response OmpR family regulator